MRECKHCSKPTKGGIIDVDGIYCWDKECVAEYDKLKVIAKEKEKAEFIKQQKCIFVPAWANRCGKTVIKDSSYCVDHHELTCAVCGKKATKQCNVASTLVCGRNLCDSCECNIYH